jgi:hypothetical protein
MLVVFVTIDSRICTRAESKNRLGVKERLKFFKDIFIAGCWYLH